MLWEKQKEKKKGIISIKEGNPSTSQCYQSLSLTVYWYHGMYDTRICLPTERGWLPAHCQNTWYVTSWSVTEFSAYAIGVHSTNRKRDLLKNV